MGHLIICAVDGSLQHTSHKTQIIGEEISCVQKSTFVGAETPLKNLVDTSVIHVTITVFSYLGTHQPVPRPGPLPVRTSEF